MDFPSSPCSHLPWHLAFQTAPWGATCALIPNEDRSAATSYWGRATRYGQGTALLPGQALHMMNWCFIWCWSCPLASFWGMTQAGEGSTWFNNSLTDMQEAEIAANKSQPSQKVMGVNPAIQIDGILKHILSHQPGRSLPYTSNRTTLSP